jgi:hypothetical protein
MIEDLTRARPVVQAWAAAHPHAVLYDDQDATLRDVASGKTIEIAWRDLAALEEKTHPETGDRYYVLLFENGSQIALVEPGGVAFAPSTENSGPVQGLPAVVCLADFFTLKQRVDHYLHDHPDEPPPRECLDMIMICIAILDGARAIGFAVDDFEAELDKTLAELETKGIGR